MEYDKNDNLLNEQNTITISRGKGLENILFDSATKIIKLRNENGRVLAFELVFSCEESKQFYCLLHPLTAVIDLSEDAAIAFSVDRNTGVFKAVNDRKTNDRIFEKYYEELSF